MKLVVQSSGLMRTFKRVLSNRRSYAVKISRIKNIRSSFFYFGAGNINTVAKVRSGRATRCLRCCHPCLNVRNPYFVLRVKPTFAWHCFMAIILKWFVACTIKSGHLPILSKIRSLPYCLCNGLRISLLCTCKHILLHTRIKLRKTNCAAVI